MRQPHRGVPDTELWERAVHHDGRAFGELFERHVDAVYTHCFRRTASWSDAEDVTSAVFLEAWRRRNEVRFYDDNVLPWFLAVANNVLCNTERARRRYHRVLAKLPPPAVASDFAEGTAQRLDDEQAMAEILDLLGELRLEDQEVVALCDWAGLSPSAAAAVLDVAPSTIRSRLTRAHQRLRHRLDARAEPCAASSGLSDKES